MIFIVKVSNNVLLMSNPITVMNYALIYIDHRKKFISKTKDYNESSPRG